MAAILEICIESISAAEAALAGGADRIEVCSALNLGGLTPSIRLVEQCIERGHSNVMMMIRPHADGFVYDSNDIAVMLADIRQAKHLGVQGVVFGALTVCGNIDRIACNHLIEAAKPLQVTFHRAFDQLLNPLEAIDELIAMGVDRVLTSGQAATAVSGLEMLKNLVQHADGRLSIIVAGDVRSHNIQQLLLTGAGEFHSSARKRSLETPENRTNLLDSSYEVCEAEVNALATAIHQRG